MTAVRLTTVSKRYRVGGLAIDALRDVSLVIESGESVAIMGPSGCGKSTLLGLIAGLEPPTTGTVSIGGIDIGGLDDDDRTTFRRERLGLVFQSADLLPFLTAAENVELALALQGRSDPEAVAALLDRLDLGVHRDKLPDQLSGGQRQRVGLARALVHGPQLILADEPTGELDSAASDRAMDLLQQAHREREATLIVVTHDPAAAARLDRIVRLHDGVIVDASPPTRELSGNVLV